MQADIPQFYAVLTKVLVQGEQPVILIDWSNADNKKRHFILRVSLALEGRLLTLLPEVIAVNDYNCPYVHQAFLQRIKASFPAECKPTVSSIDGYCHSTI